MSTDTQPHVIKRRRAWWQWVLGVGLLLAAALGLGLRYLPTLAPGIVTGWSVPPRVVTVPPELEHGGDTLGASKGDLKGANLLLVTFDTTRADRLSCYGNPKIETPAWDVMAREGVLFSNAVTPAPVTLPSHASIMTGLFPLNHGARANSRFRLKADNITLAEILSEHGYGTGAAVSAFVLDSRFGIDQGFVDFDDKVVQHEEGLATFEIPERRGDDTNAVALRWIRAHADGPFFLWVHYYDPHQVWDPPQPYAGRHTLSYDAEISFADAQFGELLDVLDELGITDSTLVVAVGDHGEGLFQHDEGSHSFLVYDSTMHVPLAMRCGTRLGGGVHLDRMASLVDIMPTALSLLGIEAPPGLDGEDLTQPPTSDDRLHYYEAIQSVADYGWAPVLGVRNGEMKYIFGAGEEELYDLSKDPFELVNLVDDQPQIAAAMRQSLHDFYGDDLVDPTDIQPTKELTADERAKLGALGYISIEGDDVPAAERPHPRTMMGALAKIHRSKQVEREKGLDATIELLEEVVEVYPDFTTALEALGDAYFRNGDFDDSEAVLKQMLIAQPGAAKPLLLLARFNRKRDRPDAAAELYKQVLARQPRDHDTMIELARMLVVHERYAEAADWLVKMLPYRPRDPLLPELMVDTLRRVGRADEALALLTRQLSKKPNLAEMRCAVARELARQHRFDEAVQMLRDGLELAPKDHLLRHNLALLLAGRADKEQQDPYEAELILEKICQETGYEDPRYLQTLAWVYSLRARTDEAIAIAQKAYDIASTSDEYSSLKPMLNHALERYKHGKAAGIYPMMKQPETQPADHDSHDHAEDEADAG